MRNGIGIVGLGALIGAGWVGWWAVAMSPPLAAQESAPIDGAVVFAAEKCGTCHSLAAAGIAATTKSDKLRSTDLGGATQRHEREWIRAYLRKELEVEGKTHKRSFKGSDEELAALLGWLDGFPEEAADEAPAEADEPSP